MKKDLANYPLYLLGRFHLLPQMEAPEKESKENQWWPVLGNHLLHRRKVWSRIRKCDW